VTPLPLFDAVPDDTSPALLPYVRNSEHRPRWPNSGVLRWSASTGGPPRKTGNQRPPGVDPFGLSWPISGPVL